MVVLGVGEVASERGTPVRGPYAPRRSPTLAPCPRHRVHTPATPLPPSTVAGVRAVLVSTGRENNRTTVIDSGLVGRGAARAGDAPGTPTTSQISPSILVYTDRGWQFRPSLSTFVVLVKW